MKSAYQIISSFRRTVRPSVLRIIVCPEAGVAPQRMVSVGRMEVSL